MSALLAVIVCVQQVKFRAHASMVERNVETLLWSYHQSGLDTYRGRVEQELSIMGMEAGSYELYLDEDAGADLLEVELYYNRPLKVLWLELDREHEVYVASPILGI